VRGVTIEAIEHQHFPLTLLGRKLARVPGADPLPPGALLRFFFGTVPAKPSGSFAGIEFEELDVGTRHCAFDLELTLIESKAGARARFEYDRDLFDAQTVATIGRRFAVLGASAAAHPDTVIWSLAPLPEDGLPAPSRMSATPAARRSKAESKLPGHRGRIGEPVTPTEEWVAGIWRDLFGLQSPRPSDDFFALGGHSLLIGGLLRRARDYNGAELSFNDVFEASTIEALAARIDRGASRRSEPAHPTLRLKPVPRNGLLQASYSQQRFWFIDLMAGGGGAINLNLALGLRGALDRAALHAGLIEIVKRHEVLRTTFVLEGGRLFQRAGPAPDFDLEPIDVSGARHHEAAVAEHVARCLAIAFDMERGPLFRFTLLAHSEIQHTLLLTLHHAISDNDSFGVMFKELSELYLARIQGRQPALPRLRAQFADFAVLQREAFEESSGKLMEFWKRELQGLAPLELKPDRPRPEQRTFAGARAHFVVPADLAQALRALAAEESCTLFMTILTGFQLFAARVSGQRHFAIGLPVAGRSTPDAESLSGPFLNSLVLRADVSGQPTFRELLRRVRARTIAALEHQEMPFERLVKELAPDRDPHRNPLFQVLFNFLQELDPPDLGELEVEILHQEIWHTVLDLSLLMADTGSGLFGSIEFNSDMFDLETVNTWCRSLLEVLRAAANDPDAPTS
jgi:hypothetical protein